MNQLWNRTKRCFSEPHARLGWILVVIGLFAWHMFGKHADWPALLNFRGPLHRTDGTVVESRSTSFSMGDDPGVSIRAVQFTFIDLGGIHRNGISWSEDTSLRFGDQVQVEFVVRDPSLARIVGWRSRPLPWWAGSAVLFLVVGVWCILRVLLGRSSSSTMGAGMSAE